MKILVDMNLSPRWAAGFRSRGIEAMHWSAVGAASAPDAEVIEWCAAHDHILLTHDLDFSAILAAAAAREPSVVQLRTHVLAPERLLERVIEALRLTEKELRAGALLTIEPDRHRVRLLPFDAD